MKAIKWFALLIIILIVGSAVVLRTLTYYVDVGEVGVRTQEYGIFGHRGLIAKDFGPGWHRDFGPIDSWQLFDSTIQTLEMTRDPQQGDRQGRDDIRVQSADGYTVSVDVTIKYRIQEGMAYKMLQITGGGMKYKTIVRNEAESACMDMFGQMTTEEFYNPHVRREKAALVNTSLQAALADKFIQVVDILVRDVQFDPEYETKIRRKKLADQEVELNKSLATAEEMSGKTQVTEAETERLVKIITKEQEAKLITMEAQTERDITKIKADYERYATERQADADLIASQLEAKGSLLIREAEAKGEELRNKAMQGVGGNTIVALEAAKNIRFSDVTISTVDTDLLDIDGMATKLGASPESE